MLGGDDGIDSRMFDVACLLCLHHIYSKPRFPTLNDFVVISSNSYILFCWRV